MAEDKKVQPDPITTKSYSVHLLVSMLLLMASLVWAVYDEVEVMRPYKDYQARFRAYYQGFLMNLRPEQAAKEEAIRNSAEYQAQALIDLALELRARIVDPGAVERVTIRTSHHTHTVIGSGANDPQKLDPGASRETLDHSIMYIFAVALEDGAWHHVDSYLPERAGRPSTVALWRRIATVEDAEWTARYHDPDPARRAFGGRVEIELADGRTVAGEKLVADAHPNGAHPWGWSDYVGKFDALAAPLTGATERDRFLDACAGLQHADADTVRLLNPVVDDDALAAAGPVGTGVFDHPVPHPPDRT